MNIKTLGSKVLMTSRGIKTNVGGIEVPEKYLRNSNVCETEAGEMVITRDMSGYELPDNQRIVDMSDILAKIVDGDIIPIFENVLVRKCIDPDEGPIITSTSQNKTKFAEILAVGPDTVLEPYIGWLAHINESDSTLQKVEEEEADWLVNQSAILMVVKPED